MAGFKLFYNDSVFVAPNVGRLASIMLQNTQEGHCVLRVSMKDHQGKKENHVLKPIVPGDRIKVQYFAGIVDEISNIEEIKTCQSANATLLEPSQRYGIDTFDGEGNAIRLSYPEGGGMTYMITFAAEDHARVFVMAGNDSEEWNWVIDELYNNATADLTIVATDWCDPYPTMEKRKAVQAK
jgi:hypothetical protein